VIYLDTSVALAHLLAEDRSPPRQLWSAPLISSRLLQYEIWNRIHARGLTGSHREAVVALLDRIATLELTPVVLARALEPFPVPVRTLDALHLSSLEFLRHRGQDVRLATYDHRQEEVARRLGSAFPADQPPLRPSVRSANSPSQGCPPGGFQISTAFCVQARRRADSADGAPP